MYEPRFHDEAGQKKAQGAADVEESRRRPAVEPQGAHCRPRRGRGRRGCHRHGGRRLPRARPQMAAQLTAVVGEIADPQNGRRDKQGYQQSTNTSEGRVGGELQEGRRGHGRGQRRVRHELLRVVHGDVGLQGRDAQAVPHGPQAVHVGLEAA